MNDEIEHLNAQNTEANENIKILDYYFDGIIYSIEENGVNFKVVNRVWFDGTGFLCAYADSTHIYLSDITSSVTKFIVFKIL